MDDVDVSGSGSELWETEDSEDDSVDDFAENLDGTHNLRAKGNDAKSCGELESLSDIDDSEFDCYLNDEGEMHYKKVIWEKLNQKYLQEQEAKKRAAAAYVSKPKREQKRKRAKPADKAQTTSEATHPPSCKKRTSSRVNYDALSKILDEPSPSDNSKRRKTETNCGQDAGENSAEVQLSDDELSARDDNDWEENQNDHSYYNNHEEDYNYDDDDNDFF